MIDKFLNFVANGTDRFSSRVVNRGYWAIATFPILKVTPKPYSVEDLAKEIPFAVSYSIGASMLAAGLRTIYKGIVPDVPKTMVQKAKEFIKSNPRDVVLAYGIAGLWGCHLMNMRKKDEPKGGKA